ncbi:hypothetical protein K435DRAFT_856367 [Dendrothele bispora CBS 962.96]|uniref:Uncharacterized protein n=1 Tax=Dendrothele bispora (strain CBS 962.96) TaxID=1314807 RepID=A0A4S8M9A7_DENBC|nr:hypothetical protein K435DRAFT_856367 [Dendrothele bispora CBS 962.96]
MTDNANSIPDNSTIASILETREDIGRTRASSPNRFSSVGNATSSGHDAQLEGFSRNEASNATLKRLLAEYQERCRQQDRELNLLRQQFDGAIVVQDRLGQRLSELGSFALLAYRGSPIQAFPNLYEILDGMFSRLYEATIRSFLWRTEATCRFFVGDENGRRQNERFLLGNIPPQVVIPTFHATLDRTRLPYPESRRSLSNKPVTPPNSPIDTRSPSFNPRKRTRNDDVEEGEIPTKRRC